MQITTKKLDVDNAEFTTNDLEPQKVRGVDASLAGGMHELDPGVARLGKSLRQRVVQTHHQERGNGCLAKVVIRPLVLLVCSLGE